MTNPTGTAALLRTLALSEDCPDRWRTVLEDCATDHDRLCDRLAVLARDSVRASTVGHPDYPYIRPDVQGV